ncbi:MAG TPA: hypothetical protein PKY50_00010 [Candidatus Competibacter sp.]|nr:hypothetical protein [Candidatus Competibacter sp.]
MTNNERHFGALVAACAKETSAHILAYARDAGLDPLSFLVNVAAVLASSALAAQPDDQLPAASRHIQNALGLVHCLQDDESETASPRDGFAAPEALQ